MELSKNVFGEFQRVQKANRNAISLKSADLSQIFVFMTAMKRLKLCLSLAINSNYVAFKFVVTGIFLYCGLLQKYPACKKDLVLPFLKVFPEGFVP